MKHGWVVLGLAVLGVVAPRPAHAGLEACNNIDVSARAECKLVAQGGCTAQCEPTRLEAACAGKLVATCDGECRADVDVACTGSCEATCRGQCDVNPGSFDCRANCDATCSADCSAQCQGSASGTTASGSCKAACESNCGVKCSAQCSGTPPTATCEGKCRASCDGSCRARASARCQIDCHARLDASCRVELEGGCKARCQQPEGALFCDGQYVDTGNNLQACIDALRATFDIRVEGSASAQCSGNQCTGEAEGSASCAAAPRTAPVLPGLAVLALVGASIARHGRKGRRSSASGRAAD
jgi:hypothetical protein